MEELVVPMTGDGRDTTDPDISYASWVTLWHEFEQQVADVILDSGAVALGELGGGVEDQRGVLEGEVGGRQQVALHASARPRSAGPSSTASRPSSSVSMTWTVSRSDVGMFLPT